MSEIAKPYPNNVHELPRQTRVPTVVGVERHEFHFDQEWLEDFDNPEGDYFIDEELQRIMREAQVESAEAGIDEEEFDKFIVTDFDLDLTEVASMAPEGELVAVWMKSGKFHLVSCASESHPILRLRALWLAATGKHYEVIR